MRTMEEIIQHYRDIESKDSLRFRREVLLTYLPAEHLQPMFPNSDLSDWQPNALSKELVIDAMREYMEFAWSKVRNHRGISASRSVQRMAEWLWLMGDEQLYGIAEDDNHYAQYGAPILAAICERYGFPIPDDEGICRMITGLSCQPECDMGCGQ